MRESVRWRANSMAFFAGRGILLIRNPIDCIVSFWNHANSGDAELVQKNYRLRHQVKADPRFKAFVLNELE